MNIPEKEADPLERLFEWVRQETRRTHHGVVYLEVDIHEGQIKSASKGLKRSERFFPGRK